MEGKLGPDCCLSGVVTEVNTFMDNMELRGSINVQLQSERRQELQTVLIDLGSS